MTFRYADDLPAQVEEISRDVVCVLVSGVCASVTQSAVTQWVFAYRSCLHDADSSVCNKGLLTSSHSCSLSSSLLKKVISHAWWPRLLQ